MSRSRVIHNRIKNASENRISAISQNKKYEKVLEVEEYQNKVISKKLGLRPKATIEQ